MLDHRMFTFMKVCETLNFTQAAKELNITQPAVTQHIKFLEDTYHVSLFQFIGKKCLLTEAGKQLLDLCHTINNDIQHLKLHLGKQASPLNFGATLTIGEFVMPDILKRMLTKNPKSNLNMIVDNTQTILEAINKGNIDFALVEGFFSKEKYDFLTYKEESFIAIASPKSSLRAGKYSYEELLLQPIIIREVGSGTREILDIALKKQHISPNDFIQRIEIGNLNTIKQLVKENLGISFIYQSAVQKELNEGSLIEIQLIEPPIKHDFTFIWRKNSHFKNDYLTLFNTFFKD